jgi:hypothetical protein
MVDVSCYRTFLPGCFMHMRVLVTLRGASKMKRVQVLVVLATLSFLSGCYVNTSVKVQNRQLPADFSAPVLVVTVQDKAGVVGSDLALLEENALQNLSDKGINCISLRDAVGEEDLNRATKLLIEEEYRALLTIVIDFWGSKTELVQDPVLTSVGSSDTGPEPGSIFIPPGSLNSDESVHGQESDYKEVSMVGYLTDLQSSRSVWSARVNARPAVVGRSCLYHRFNRGLKYDEMANRCLKKIAGELGRIWPEE